jgi:hypothetical protein
MEVFGNVIMLFEIQKQFELLAAVLLGVVMLR